MKSKRFSFLSQSTDIALFVFLLLLAGCGVGSQSPTSPSSQGGVTVNGSVLGASSSSASAAADVTSSDSKSFSGRLVISVQSNPGLSTSVGSDGTFTLRGVPAGSFTLVFTLDGTRVGTLSFSSVLPDQELIITVSLSGSLLALLHEGRSGGDRDGQEIEGRVEQVLLLSATGDSRFVIRSRTVVVRPGVTLIREGSRTRLPGDLIVGLRVKVKATPLPIEGTIQPLLATEIKIEDDDDDDDHE